VWIGSPGKRWRSLKSWPATVLIRSWPCLKSKTPRENPSVKSLANLFWNANWYEREIWEMFGINFEGHPGLYPLLLGDELVGVWPWRKDFKGYPDLTTGQRAVERPTSEGYTSTSYRQRPLRLRPAPSRRRSQNIRPSERGRRRRSSPTQR